MLRKGLISAIFLGLLAPAAAFAYSGTLTFKGGCAVSNSGNCILKVSGVTGEVKIYASSSENGTYGAVSTRFTAPGSKRIANSTNNKCFYAKVVATGARTRKICLSK